MCLFIGVECLAVNALIEMCQNGIEQVSFKMISDYGLTVIDEFEANTSTRAIIIFKNNDLKGLVINYSEFFDIIDDNGEQYLCKKKNVTLDELKEQFRWPVPYDFLKALLSENSLYALRVQNLA